MEPARAPTRPHTGHTGRHKGQMRRKYPSQRYKNEGKKHRKSMKNCAQVQHRKSPTFWGVITSIICENRALVYTGAQFPQFRFLANMQQNAAKVMENGSQILHNKRSISYLILKRLPLSHATGGDPPPCTHRDGPGATQPEPHLKSKPFLKCLNGAAQRSPLFLKTCFFAF